MSSLDGIKLGNRNSCHCLATQNKDNGFDRVKNNDQDTRSKRHLTVRLDNRAKKITSQQYAGDEAPIGDERVSELYIFPNSNVVEFTDISYDDKV